MWIIYPLIFLSGFVDSIAGGGGLISLTSFLAVGLPAHLALGTNKFSAFAGTAIATGRFAKGGYIHWPSAISALVGALIGSAVGAHLALLLNERYLQYLMLILVPAIAVFLLVKKDFGTKTRSLSTTKLLVCSFLTGLIVGCYDGFFGPGTGTFLILAFTTVLGFETVTACGNAKVINSASNFAALITFLLNGQIDYKIGIPCAVCGILGNYVGSGLAIRRGARVVRPLMFVVIAMLLFKVVWDLAV